MKHGFVKIAAATPNIRVGDCRYNAEQIVQIVCDSEKDGAKLIVFPELCVTGYTCGDLFLQDTLLRAAEDACAYMLKSTVAWNIVVVVGMPVVYCGKFYNCAVVMQAGKLLGIVPKTNLPNYGEFQELRHFTPGGEVCGAVILCGQTVPINARMLFSCNSLQDFRIGIEICEDLWVAIPASSGLARAGATVIANLSASNETIGKAAYRRLLLKGQSARLNCAYVYADAGWGESTTDLVFAGHNLIAENGQILLESMPFAQENTSIYTEIDLRRIAYERRRQNTCATPCTQSDYHIVTFDLDLQETLLTRPILQEPFVPETGNELAARCEEVLMIQAQGLRKRMAHIGESKPVIGISGGLDSTLALLVCVRAQKLLGAPINDILALTMPCFGTTARTKSNAQLLCEALGVPCKTVDITATVRQHFLDIEQPIDKLDAAFENAQARERTQVLMDTANQVGGLVVGTGDLSELALGWATFNGDHMSMYGVNASVPKTLVRHIVKYVADTCGEECLKRVLYDILDTPVSPELLPAENGEISQQTEQIVGPYALHDFFLYHFMRWGMEPEKILRLAVYAFAGVYDRRTILHWLRVFTKRFFTQQFKRSCLPDGPKVGSVSLSPRGDWRMPSDAQYAAWLVQLEDA